MLERMRLVILVMLSACGFEVTLPSSEPAIDANNSPGNDGAVDDARDVIEDGPPALVDAPQVSWTLIDTLTVPSNGAPVFSNAMLAGGTTYRLRASGTFEIQSTGTRADAEFWDFSNPQEGVVGVDIGIGIDDMTVDETRTPKWGAYNASHIYEVMYTGQGRPLRANIHDGNPTNNSGSLTLEVFALQ